MVFFLGSMDALMPKGPTGFVGFDLIALPHQISTSQIAGVVFIILVSDTGRPSAPPTDRLHLRARPDSRHHVGDGPCHADGRHIINVGCSPLPAALVNACVALPTAPRLCEGRLPDLPVDVRKHPVVLFLHGSSCIHDANKALGRHLAERGFAMAAPDEQGLPRVYRRCGDALVLSITLVPGKAYTAAVT